jgi:hypothetical protein
LLIEFDDFGIARRNEHCLKCGMDEIRHFSVLTMKLEQRSTRESGLRSTARA